MSQHEKRPGRLRLPVAALAALLVLVGVVALIIGVRAQRTAPQPPASAAVPLAAAVSSSAAPATSASASSSAAAKSASASAPVAEPSTTGPILARSVPTQLSIPAIGVTSDLLGLGLNADGTVQVPPLTKDSRAGWYRNSPTPGQLGPSVLLGHIDSAKYGPGVFFKLGALRQGEQVTVTRSDHTAAVFEINRVVSYPKDHFPTLEVYGNTNNAQLRLITCGGKFDISTHNYLSNIVVYATLVSSHHV